MPNVEIMEPGSHLRTTGNIIPAKHGQEVQSEGQTFDSLMNVRLKHLEPARQGSAESQEESGELNKPGKESPDVTAVESTTPIDQPENKDSVVLSTNLLLGTLDPSGQIKEKGNGDQENKTVLSAALLPSLESFFSGKGQILKEFLNKAENLNSSLSGALLLNKGEGPVIKLDQSPAAGTPASAEDPGVGSPGLVNPNQERPVQGISLRGSFDLKEGLNSGGEGEPSEKGKERQQGLSLFFKEGFLDDPRGTLAAKDREGSKISFDFEGLNNKDLPQNGEILQGKGSGQAQPPPTDLTDSVLGNSTGTEKIVNYKPNPLDHFPKSFELDFLKDHYFTLKNKTPSSMEISLEPAGLGKLDIELNLNQDRLQGRIMVNDTAGKELIERNLPQLLSDLTRDGLQIGGFTVSLKNQGRGQTPVPDRTEFKEPSLITVGPERIVPIQGNHLIHIII